MEKSEVLRPGFIDMVKPGATVLLADTQIFPYGIDEGDYPSEKSIKDFLTGYTMVQVNVLDTALRLGDESGRSANVVMMGALSTLHPFCDFPSEVWLLALKNVSPTPAIWSANYAAFTAGRELL